MNERKTAWYPHGVKPVRSGVYEVMVTSTGTVSFMSYFSYYSKRTGWRACCFSTITAHENRHYPTDYQVTHWRGMHKRSER